MRTVIGFLIIAALCCTFIMGICILTASDAEKLEEMQRRMIERENRRIDDD